MKSKVWIFIFALLLCNFLSRAQMSQEQKRQVIDSLCIQLEKCYVFPEVASNIALYLKTQLTANAYKAFSKETTFANKLSLDLFEISGDRHLKVSYSDQILPKDSLNPFELSPEHYLEQGNFALRGNYGIDKLEVLNGNIGLIAFSMLCGPEHAGDTYSAMMNYIGHTDALIIDLRNCRGAMGKDAIPFLSSYFFNEPVHLNDFKWRWNNSLEQKWTYAHVPGKRYIDKPIYIINSARTFSGAEELAYDLQVLNKATIIGEKTAGGANPGGSIRITDHFECFIPFGQAINPITKTNWEGVGVLPDTPVKANLALYEAHKMAIRQLIPTTEDEEWKFRMEDFLSDLETHPPVFQRLKFELKGFENAKTVFLTGSFNYWASQNTPMIKKGNIWQVEVECLPGTVQYQFIVDGIRILDPNNKETIKAGPYVNSIKAVN